jgi:pyruvate formate lyase activating enzyme
MNGIITDIQRFSIHDGPGIRTTVFLKGCSNRCAWCHNPETFSLRPQLEFFEERCIHCGKCYTICSNGVHSSDGERHLVNHKLCIACNQCVDSCYAGALVIAGRETTTDDIMEQIMMDEPYYRRSGGGVTLSGGEPVLQWEFTLALLKKCKEAGIHTALQTAGNYHFEYLDKLLPYVDLVMYDIKAFSEDIYKNVIHGDRDRILNNLKALDQRKFPIIVRTPVIGSVNDHEQEIEQIAMYLSDMTDLSYYMLLPYHGLGKVKYDALNLEYKNSFYTPAKDKMEQLEKVAAKYIKVYNTYTGYITT